MQATLFQQTEILLKHALDYVEKCHPQDELPSLPHTLTAYQQVEAIDYPRSAVGEIQAMIHPQLQSRDYEPLHPGDPVFLSFDGDAINYTGDSITYPIFINEAAYYEKGNAMILTQKKTLELSNSLNKQAL